MNTVLKICRLGLLLASLALSGAANAEELGRLFFTAEERARIDYAYAQNIKPGANARTLMLNGIVQMHGGKRTAWINGVPQAVGRSDEKTPESVPVPLPGQNKTVQLKVGQRLLLNPTANAGTTGPDTPKLDTTRQ
jgi:hypothetical protein